MPAARYWRIVAIDTYAGADLELSALHLYGGAARLDAAATIASTFTPAAGTLAALQDDALASTCRFAGAAVRSGGFAIIWDFGAGNTADVTGLRIAGTLRDDFLVMGMLQYSADGRLWQWQADVATDWPGAGAYHDPAGGDPYYNSVSLLLHMDGIDGSVAFTDVSALPKAVTAYGNAKVSTAQSKFGGASAYFDGVGDALKIPYHSGFNFGTGDFTVEAWVWQTGPVSQWREIFMLNVRDGLNILLYDGKLVVGRELVVNDYTASEAITQNTWHHIAVTRSAGIARGFVDGVQVFSGPSVFDFFQVGEVSVGGKSNGINALSGYLDDLRITKGVARYTANFTPPTEPSESTAVGLPRAPAPDRVRIAAASPVPAHSALSAPPLLLARDMEFGGSGTVTGTVERKGTPANVPLRRRVRLHSDVSGNVVRETWSNAITGEFAFTDIDPTQRYTTIAYDYEHNFRAEAADNLTPEVSP